MPRRIATAVILLAITAVAAGNVSPGSATPPHPEGLTVHEWGTFTTVAGEDGSAIQWLPLSGPNDLPCFVEHFPNPALLKGFVPGLQPLDYASARSQLWGRVRMETPVVYFYTAEETRVSVTVRFPRGLMTEWYPRAKVTPLIVDRASLHDPGKVSVIQWPSVMVAPNAAPRFPTDVEQSHYYAARATDASPVIVNDQIEKFLFYRGVADFDVPLTAAALPDGSLRIRNIGPEPLPAVIVFENRRGAIGYRILGALAGEVTLAAPKLDGTFERLRHEMQRMLVASGLYAREAAAMVETWRDSWFEEGVRVFYVVPPKSVDEILPLTVSPAPTRVERVFVGRMDVVTPFIQQAVTAAIALDDRPTLERYGRFLGSITDRIMARNPGAIDSAAVSLTNAALRSYLTRATICE